MCTQILTCEQQSNITCEVIGFFHVWMKLYTLKNYINKIFPHVNWMWRFSHGTQNHVKFPHFQMWIEYFPMWTIFNCNMWKTNWKFWSIMWIQQFSHLYIFLNVNFEFENVKRKKRHMWTWKCKQVSIFSITWITMSTCESHTFTCDGLFPSGRRRPHKYINILQLYADQQAAMHVHISHASSGTLAFVFPSLSLSVTLSVLVVK